MVRSLVISLLAVLTAALIVSCGSTPAAPAGSVPTKAPTAATTPQTTPAVENAVLKKDLLGYSGKPVPEALLKAADGSLAKRQLKPEQLGRDDQLLYGDLLLANQKFDDAKALYERLLSRNDKDKEALISLAKLAGDQPDKQRVYLNRLLATYPADVQVKVLQGQIEQDTHNLPAAQTAFNVALKSGDNADALLGLAQIAEVGKKWDQALDYLDRAVKADPENDLIYSERAKVHSQKEQYYDAENDINKALSLQPDNPWHAFDRARLYWLHMYKPQDALADLDKVVARDSQNFLAHVYRAEILDSQNKAKEAWDEYQTVLTMHGDYREAYPPAAILAFHFKDYAKALQVAQEAWKDYPGEYAFPIIAYLSAQALGQGPLAKTFVDKGLAKFAPTPTVAEFFRFLNNPRSDYYLNDLISKEKDKTTVCRLRFYQGCVYVQTKAGASARAAFQAVTEFKLVGVPEIRMAKDWLEDLK